MGERTKSTRVLIYSHDTFGLGHLRRCRRIAESLVAKRDKLSVLIISGSPIIGSFDFRSRVDFVRVPGVIKLRNGEYSSLNLHLDVAHVLRMRSSIIKHTAEVFEPDLLVVDKEPLGLRGEIHETLWDLKERGTPLVLGLRDVMDDPELLRREWARKNPVPALEELYDQIWVYGLSDICDPLAGLQISSNIRDKMVYTGYLKSTSPTTESGLLDRLTGDFQAPFVLVTTGGGGDGEDLIDWVLRAYEHHGHGHLGALPPALLVFGPFMRPQLRDEFQTRVDVLPQVRAITFDARVEQFMAAAAGVVAMGGYNTFCEILTLDKRAVIVPRRRPRLEQFIRASRADALGLVRMLSDEEDRCSARMAEALRGLADQARPSQVLIPGLFSGLDTIQRLTNNWLDVRDPPLAVVLEG